MVDWSGRASFRGSGPMIVVAAAGGIIALLSLVTPVLSIRTDSIAPEFATGDWYVADLGVDLPGALVAALLALAIGVVAAVDGRPWGHGLTAGAGLATIGWGMLALGTAQIPVTEVYDALSIPVADPYSVTITRRVGYGLLVADVVLGLAWVGLSITLLGRRRTDSFGPWIAAIGAVGVVVAVTGWVVPVGGAEWSGDAPVLYLIGRGVPLILMLVGGVVGFLLVSEVGLGLVIGSLSAPAWLTVWSLVGDDRLVARGTSGELGTGVPHLLAPIGIGVAVIAVVVAAVRSWRRDRRAMPPFDH